ncbi:aurachin C monooxygenase/isomerase-like [Benincasa hispida]|uniref:aurachin C monooxygenase/isomerase-like n=1 Tax=Benincasa hispida TaxID=102211 RepID=UPI0019013D6E|nr:aurachin C monooxygenase/isomerase-like [Benincasa hispida]
MVEKKEKPKAVIVGGSIAGISCAHTLLKAGWEVQVLERSSTPPTGCSTGAGLALDPLSQRLLQSWLSRPELLLEYSLPLATEQVEISPLRSLHSIDGESKRARVLSNDENFNFRASHWADLHSLLYNELPSDIFLWGHLFLSLCISDDKTSVKIKARVVESGEIVEIIGDLLVAADGCLSSIRQTFLPNFKLRYSGYYGWRGVFDFSERENLETVMNIRKAYPEIGKCLYMDLASNTHILLFEIPKKKINWVWFVNEPQPQLKARSMSMKVNETMVKKLHQQVDEIWVPELAKVVKETKDPFINVIYDCDPLEQIVWDNVVLVGEAAHPTTPHCARSTNMALLDAFVLGECLLKWGLLDLKSALAEYQSLRLPVIYAQVLHSRHVGRIKQGSTLSDRERFDPSAATTTQNFPELQIRNTPFLDDVPRVIDLI